MVNLARSAALCCTITTLICGLTSLLQLSCIFPINREPYRSNRQRGLEMLTGFFVDTLLQSNERKSQTTILDSAWENLACELLSGQIKTSIDEAQRSENEKQTVGFNGWIGSV